MIFCSHCREKVLLVEASRESTNCSQPIIDIYTVRRKFCFLLFIARTILKTYGPMSLTFWMSAYYN